MTAFAAAGGASLLAHGVHWTIVLGGTAGLVALVLPPLLDRVLPGPAREPAGAAVTTPVVTGTSARRLPQRLPQRLSAGPSLTARRHLPVALVASAAAAGVHAAVGPAHLAGRSLVGTFFLVCAAAQVAWAAALLLGAGRRLLAGGAVGHVGLLVLWSLSRTGGLPGLAGPQPLGAWDVLAAGWHVAVVAACARALVDGRVRTRVAGWWDWDPTARRWLAGSAVALGLASLTRVV